MGKYHSISVIALIFFGFLMLCVLHALNQVLNYDEDDD